MFIPQAGYVESCYLRRIHPVRCPPQPTYYYQFIKVGLRTYKQDIPSRFRLPTSCAVASETLLT